MHSASPLKEMKSAVMVMVSPPYSSLVLHELFPSTSSQSAYALDHFMPNRLWSCVASPERWSPCPDSTMIWAIVQPAGCPYSSWQARASSTIS